MEQRRGESHVLDGAGQWRVGGVSRALDGACGQSGGEGLHVRGGMLVGWGIHGVGFMPDDVTWSSLQLHVLLAPWKLKPLTQFLLEHHPFNPLLQDLIEYSSLRCLWMNWTHIFLLNTVSWEMIFFGLFLPIWIVKWSFLEHIKGSRKSQFWLLSK